VEELQVEKSKSLEEWVPRLFSYLDTLEFSLGTALLPITFDGMGRGG